MDKSYTGLRFNSQFYFCPVPFVLDTYQGCTHNCLYCFARTGMWLRAGTNKRDFFEIRGFNSSVLRNLFNGSDQKADTKVLRDCINARIPLHIGGLSDPFQHCEKQENITLEVLKILKEKNYPFIISTKSTLAAEEPYLSLLKFSNCLVQYSLITLNEDLWRKLESGAPSPEQRLNAIKTLSSNGVKVIVRLQPLLPSATEGVLKDFVEKVKAAGAKGITVEWLKLSAFRNEKVDEIYEVLSNALGIDLGKYYKEHGEKTGSDYELLPSEKIEMLLKLRDFCHEVGLQYFVADNAFRALGDSPICCGLTMAEYMAMTGKEPAPCFNVALFKAKAEGKVKFNDVYNAQNTSCLSNEAGVGWLKESGIKMGGVLDNKVGCWLIGHGSGEEREEQCERPFGGLVANAWNNRDSPLNPMNFFIGLKQVGVDEKGFKIFAYDENAFNETAKLKKQQKNLGCFESV